MLKAERQQQILTEVLGSGTLTVAELAHQFLLGGQAFVGPEDAALDLALDVHLEPLPLRHRERFEVHAEVLFGVHGG